MCASTFCSLQRRARQSTRSSAHGRPTNQSVTTPFASHLPARATPSLHLQSRRRGLSRTRASLLKSSHCGVEQLESVSQERSYQFFGINFVSQIHSCSPASVGGGCCRPVRLRHPSACSEPEHASSWKHFFCNHVPRNAPRHLKASPRSREPRCHCNLHHPSYRLS